MNVDCGEASSRYYLVDDDEVTVPCKFTKDPKPFGMRVYLGVGLAPLVLVRELPHSPAPPSWHMEKIAVLAFRAVAMNTDFKLFVSERTPTNRLIVSRVEVKFGGRPLRPWVATAKAVASSWGEVNRIIRGEGQ